MNKYEFLAKLSRELEGLPREEIKERINFYTEMIDDAVEEGISEEEAVARISKTDADEAEKIAMSAVRPPKRKLGAWELVLIILSSPLWLSLAAVAVSLYASVWAVVISLWAVFASLAASAFGVLFCAAVEACKGGAATAAALVGAALISAGVSIFAFYGCKALTKGVILLTKKLFKRRKRDE